MYDSCETLEVVFIHCKSLFLLWTIVVSLYNKSENTIY